MQFCKKKILGEKKRDHCNFLVGYRISSGYCNVLYWHTVQSMYLLKVYE